MIFYTWEEVVDKIHEDPDSVPYRLWDAIGPVPMNEFESFDEWEKMNQVRTGIIASVFDCFCHHDIVALEQEIMKYRRARAQTPAEYYAIWQQNTEEILREIERLARPFREQHRCHTVRGERGGLYCFCDEHNHVSVSPSTVTSKDTVM